MYLYSTLSYTEVIQWSVKQKKKRKKGSKKHNKKTV